MRRVISRVTFAVWAAGVVVSAQGGLRDIGVSDQALQDSVYQSVVGNYPSIPSPQDAIRAVPAARRADVLLQAGTAAKSYLRSDAFRQRYLKDLTEGRFGPAAPKPAQTFADHLREQQAELDHSLAELRKGANELPPQMREQGAAMIRQAESTVQEQKRQAADVSPDDRASWERDDRERFTQETADYREAVAQGHALPPDPNDLVRLRLRQFLADTADVDFDAALTPQRTFTKPAYEAKPSIWKVCYRAGRLATAAARTYAQSWLNELK